MEFLRDKQVPILIVHAQKYEEQMRKENPDLPFFQDEIKKLKNMNPNIQILATTYKDTDYKGSLQEEIILVPPLHKDSATQLFAKTAENSQNKTEIIEKFTSVIWSTNGTPKETKSRKQLRKLWILFRFVGNRQLQNSKST